MHNLSFKAADHLSELFPFMFPDSAIAAFKRTKTKSIVSDAYMKKPVIEILRVAPFSLLCGDSIKLLTAPRLSTDTTWIKNGHEPPF